MCVYTDTDYTVNGEDAAEDWHSAQMISRHMYSFELQLNCFFNVPFIVFSFESENLQLGVRKLLMVSSYWLFSTVLNIQPCKELMFSFSASAASSTFRKQCYNKMIALIHVTILTLTFLNKHSSIILYMCNNTNTGRNRNSWWQFTTNLHQLTNTFLIV